MGTSLFNGALPLIQKLLVENAMDEFNTSRTRRAVLYGSMVVILFVAVGFFAVYQMPGSLNHPSEVQGDPTKRLGTGDSVSKNPATIDAIDKPIQKSP